LKTAEASFRHIFSNEFNSPYLPSDERPNSKVVDAFCLFLSNARDRHGNSIVTDSVRFDDLRIIIAKACADQEKTFFEELPDKEKEKICDEEPTFANFIYYFIQKRNAASHGDLGEVRINALNHYFFIVDATERIARVVEDAVTQYVKSLLNSGADEETAAPESGEDATQHPETPGKGGCKSCTTAESSKRSRKQQKKRAVERASPFMRARQLLQEAEREGVTRSAQYALHESAVLWAFAGFQQRMLTIVYKLADLIGADVGETVKAIKESSPNKGAISEGSETPEASFRHIFSNEFNTPHLPSKEKPNSTVVEAFYLFLNNARDSTGRKIMAKSCKYEALAYKVLRTLENEQVIIEALASPLKTVINGIGQARTCVGCIRYLTWRRNALTHKGLKEVVHIDAQGVYLDIVNVAERIADVVEDALTQYVQNNIGYPVLLGSLPSKSDLQSYNKKSAANRSLEEKEEEVEDLEEMPAEARTAAGTPKAPADEASQPDTLVAKEDGPSQPPLSPGSSEVTLPEFLEAARNGDEDGAVGSLTRTRGDRAGADRESSFEDKTQSCSYLYAALFIAAASGYADLTRALLSTGIVADKARERHASYLQTSDSADLRKVGKHIKEGMTPLILAAANGQYSVVKALLEGKESKRTTETTLEV